MFNNFYFILFLVVMGVFFGVFFIALSEDHPYHGGRYGALSLVSFAFALVSTLKLCMIIVERGWNLKSGQKVKYYKLVGSDVTGFSFKVIKATYVEQINDLESIILSPRGNRLHVYTDYIVDDSGLSDGEH